MKRIFLIIICLLTVKTVDAQKGFIDGYYVNNLNDTIKAKIKMHEYWKNITVLDSLKKKKKLKPGELKAFNFLNLVNYRVIYIPTSFFWGKTHYFMEVIEEGDVILYGLMPPDYSGRGIKLSYMMQRKGDDSSLEYAIVNMKKLMQDNDEIMNIINSMNITDEHIPALVKKYNLNKLKKSK